MSDDGNNYFEDGSWMEAEEMTTPPGGRGKGGGLPVQHGLVFCNTDYESDGGEGDSMELTQTKQSSQRTSDF